MSEVKKFNIYFFGVACDADFAHLIEHPQFNHDAQYVMTCYDRYRILIKSSPLCYGWEIIAQWYVVKRRYGHDLSELLDEVYNAIVAARKK